MECKCPNCKETADRLTIDEVDYINCPECGWFQAQADGSMIPCDPPSSNSDRPPEPGQKIDRPAAPEPEPAALEPDPATPAPEENPAHGDDIDDSDETGIEIEIGFED